MSVEALESFIAAGMMASMMLVYIIAGIIFLVVSSKVKKKNPKDAKNWFWVGIIMFGFAAIGLLGTIFAFVAVNLQTAG